MMTNKLDQYQHIGKQILKCDEDDHFEQVTKLFDTMSLKINDCVCCNKKSCKLFGGFCNHCITPDHYFFNIRVVDNIISDYINDAVFLDLFDSIFYNLIADIKHCDYDYIPIILYIKVCILRCARNILISKSKKKVEKFFGIYFYYFLKLEKNMFVPDILYNLLELFNINVNITTSVTILESDTPCFLISIVSLFQNDFSITSNIYFFTDHTDKFRKIYCGTKNNFIDLSRYNYFIDTQSMLCFKLKFQRIIMDTFQKQIYDNNIHYKPDSKLGLLIDYCKIMNKDMDDDLLGKSRRFDTIKMANIRHSYNHPGSKYKDYNSLWGNLYFTLTKTEKNTVMPKSDIVFIFLVRLESFIRKYFPVRPYRCYSCSKNIGVCVLGNCDKCIFNVRNSIYNNILIEFGHLLSDVKEIPFGDFFPEILRSLIRGLKTSSKIRKSDAYDHLQCSHLFLQLRILKIIFFNYVSYHGKNYLINVKNISITKKNIKSVMSWNNLFTLMFHNSPFFRENSVMMFREIPISNQNRYFDFLIVVNNHTLLVEIDDPSHNNYYANINDNHKNNLASFQNIPLYRIDLRKIPKSNIDLEFFIIQHIENFCTFINNNIYN
jgi:hypothetical protein